MKRSALGLIALAMLWGCTTEAPQPAPKPQPPDLLTGRSAFQQLYVAARGWAGDIRPYRLQSSAIGENDGHDGKAVVWHVMYGGSRNDAKLILDVDATTGEFLRKEG